MLHPNTQNFVSLELICQLQVSEMVHFDFNSEEMLMTTLQSHISGIDPLSRCTNMLFNLSKKSENYFLVVIVERIYGSDDNSAYVSPAKIHKNPKARAESAQVSVVFLSPSICFLELIIVFNFFSLQRFAKNASKYGYLRRPFAWTAHRLFQRSENEEINLVEGTFF